MLDLCSVPTGESTGEALRRSVDLARHAEGWGLTRYWVAEHHNLPGIASSAPAVLVGQIASATSAIRVGSGGVMLPNHAPLAVAEQFGTLEALHPGRIDLGIGRASGADRGTARALRRSAEGLSAADFARQLAELQQYFLGQPTENCSPGQIRAIPAEGNRPTVWLLGSTGSSAENPRTSDDRSGFAVLAVSPAARRSPCTSRTTSLRIPPEANSTLQDYQFYRCTSNNATKIFVRFMVDPRENSEVAYSGGAPLTHDSLAWIREVLTDYLQRQLGRMSVSEGSIAAMSSGSLVMTGCPRSLAQMATLTSTMSAVRVAAQRAPTRSAILVSSGTTDVTDARSKRAIRA